MDQIDRAILGALADEGRITINELAARVQLSPSAARDRLRRLEQRNAIRGYRAELDATALGYPLHALVAIDLRADADMDAFERALRERPAIVEALHATGEHDYLLRLRCADIDELHRTVRTLKTALGVVRTTTTVVLDAPIPLRPRLPAETLSRARSSPRSP